MCHYVNMRFIGCNHPRTLVLYRCDLNVNKACPAPCFRPLVEAHVEDCTDMQGKCPGCDPTPRTTQVCAPSAYFAKVFRGLGKDLISRGQWIPYTEMQIAFREIFNWDMPAVLADRLFNESGEASAQLTPLKTDMMQKLDQLRIPLRRVPIPIHTPIYFGEGILHRS